MKKNRALVRLSCILSLMVFSVLILTTTASAGYVEYSAMQNQTVTGEDFSFIFDPVLLSDGSPGYFTIEARGDYFGKSTEYLGFDIEGIFFQDVVTEGEVTYIYSDGNDDRWWTKTWTISGADMLLITSDADGEIEVNLNAGQGVGVDAINDTAFVEVTLGYNAVPIPGALILFGSGLCCLLGLRRKMS